MPFIAFLPDGSFGRIGINEQERFGPPDFRVPNIPPAYPSEKLGLKNLSSIAKTKMNDHYEVYNMEHIALHDL